MTLGDELGYLPYSALLNFALCMFGTNALFAMSQYSGFVSAREEKAGAGAGLCLILVLFGIGPNLFLLLGFNFGENQLEPKAGSLPQTNLQFVSWLIHIIAAGILFLSIGACSFIFVYVVEPIALTGSLEPLEDVRAKYFWSRAVAYSFPVGVIVRGLHIFHSRSLWCMPLLIWEIWVLTAACGFVLHGFLRTMMMLDAQSPILSWGAFVRLLRREVRSGIKKNLRSGHDL